MHFDSATSQEAVRVIIADHGARWFSHLGPAANTSQSVVIARILEEPPHLFVQRVLKRLLGLMLSRVVDVAYVDGQGEGACRSVVLSALEQVHGIRSHLSASIVA